MGTIESVVNLTEENKGDVLLLRLKGRLDAVSSPVAEKRVFDSINRGQVKLIFDFSEVTYLSSAGMRMLLSITKKLKPLSGHLVVCSVKPDVLDVLRMSGFDHILDLSITEIEALRQFGEWKS